MNSKRSICVALVVAAMLAPLVASARSTERPPGIYVRVLFDETDGPSRGCPIGTQTRRLGNPVNTCPGGRRSDAICISGRPRNVRVVWWAPRGDSFEIRMKDGEPRRRWTPVRNNGARNRWVATAKGRRVRGGEFGYDIIADECTLDPRIVVSNDSLSLVELLAELVDTLDVLSDARIASLAAAQVAELEAAIEALLALLDELDPKGGIPLAGLRSQLDETLAGLSDARIANLPATRVVEVAEQMEALLDLLDELEAPEPV